MTRVEKILCVLYVVAMVGVAYDVFVWRAVA